MDCSKNITSKTYYNNMLGIEKPFLRTRIIKQKNKKLNYSQLIIGISVICFFLILIDGILIFSFANMLQTML